MKDWKNYQDQHQERFLQELLDLLRIPSISARSENKADMVSCAEAVKDSLLAAGASKRKFIPPRGTRSYMAN